METTSCQHCCSRSNSRTVPTKVTIWTLLLVLFLPHVCGAKNYFPPFFNAALRKPIIADPEDSSCGANTAYCDSYTDIQSTKECKSATCSAECPYGTDFPRSEHFSNLVDTSVFTWGNCVRRENSFLAPTSSSTEAMSFSGSGSDCNMPLKTQWLVHIFLIAQYWNTSFSVWIYNQLGNNEGTLLDTFYDDSQPDSVFRISVMGEQLRVTSGPQVYAHPAWVIPRNTWTLLGVQLLKESISVFIDGEHVPPSYHAASLRSNRNARTWWLGKSATSFDPFIGYLQEFKVYDSVLVNRGMTSLYYNATLADTRIQSSCQCPTDFPLLKDSDPTFCVQNPGESRSPTESYRLNTNTHPLEFVNDDKENSAWITTTPLKEVSLEIDLEDVFEVRKVQVHFFSPIPALLTIERMASDNDTWSPWQHYSINCQQWVGQDSDQPIIADDDIICKNIVNFEEQYVYSGARVIFDVLEGRPGLKNGVPSPLLKNFLMTRAIRVTLKGHPFVTQDGHKYHAIKGIMVNATCDCNGHGTDCYLDQFPYTCQCAPESYTTGRQCDVCVEHSFMNKDVNLNDPTFCNACDCDLTGTVEANTTCDKIGGQCQCKPLVAGRSCDSCQEGYFNLTSENSLGCDACNCNTNGTIDGSPACNATTGQCMCKANVQGVRCDQCKPGFLLLSADHVDGCLGCTCNDSGVIPANETCDYTTGNCYCKKYVTGRNCDHCVGGTYDLSISKEDGCEPCLCDTTFGAANSSCDDISGQCNCLGNVVGKRCNSCKQGFFAMDKPDAQKNGCSNKCDCDALGTLSSALNTCEELGGQCKCNEFTTGRRCDQCTAGYFNFSSSLDTVCTKCQCDSRGTIDKTVCNKVSGQCQCKVNVQSLQCDSCMDHSYGLSLGEPKGCKDCDCFERGTVPDTMCNVESGQCDCLPREGDAKKGGRKCMAYIDSILPNYGPKSGGTKIQLNTGYLGNVSDISIKIGNIPCMINSTISNQTSVNCTTSSMSTGNARSDGLLLYAKQKLRIDFASEVVTTEQTFMFMDDPVIDTIEPLNTIVSGGINLTVAGQHLDSVMFPRMTVTMVYKPSGANPINMQFSSGCTVINNSTMKCPTPELEVPPHFIGRRKRSTDEDALHGSRGKRQAKDSGRNANDINDDQLNFYLGFILDGVETYKNMSVVNPKYGILSVYYDPELKMFDETDKIKMFRKYWPIEDTHLLIKGENLNLGLAYNDYTIVIGDDFCTDVQLYDSFISCLPPNTVPEVVANSGVDHPQVMVRVGRIEFLVGFLHYQTSIWSYLPFRYGIIGGCSLLAVIILIIIVCCVSCRSKEKGSQADSVSGKSSKTAKTSKTEMSFISAFDMDDDISPYMVTPGHDMLSILPEDIRASLGDLVVNRSKVDVGQVVGEGHYGKVHVGRFAAIDGASPEPVAIKTLKAEKNLSSADTTQFLEEATMMKTFQHNNVLAVLGVVVDSDQVMVIMPYMENGDLKTFISKDDNMLTVGELIHFGLQIATGMAYLAERHFVHRDLACRNCMVNKHLIVKVADFGLTRDIYEQDYYRVGTKKRALPVKWMSMESLDRGLWTTKSDVWSYGVVLWELLTRGCPPYPDVDAYDIKTYLSRGKRMDRPDYAPDEIYSLMLNCWREDPDRRPSFHQIRDKMSYFLNEVNTQTFTRDKQGQQVPSIAFRGRSYREMKPSYNIGLDMAMTTFK